jgi:hypothetical protein
MSHELVGLTHEEIEENYVSQYPELRSLLDILTDG